MKCKYDCFSCPYEDCINNEDRTPEESRILEEASVKDGYKSSKKKRERMKQYYQEHKEKYREYNRQYRAKHREQLNKYRNDFYYAHHEYEKERQRKYAERKKQVQ